MKIAAVLFMILLTLSATTIATVSIASNMCQLVPKSHVHTVLFDVDSKDEQPNGDPVGGGGGPPGPRSGTG